MCFILITLFTVHQQVFSQEANSPNTLKRSKDFVPPKAKIDDVAWIAGNWKGAAMGGEFTESWDSPSSGSMVGMFKMHGKQGVSFYEILTISELEGSLILRLKHFAKDLKGWEEKNEVVEKPLLHLKHNEACFEGLTFRAHDANQMSIFVSIAEKDGAAKEVEFECKRVGQGSGDIHGAPKVSDQVADGIYLIQRWSISKKELLPLLPGEMLIQDDPSGLGTDKDNEVRFITVNSRDAFPFSSLAAAKRGAKTDGRTSLQVTFDDSSAKKMEDLTRRNLGRQIAVVFDGKAVTTHKIRSRILNGKVKITRCTDNGCETILENLKK